jgi:hypothetical protein
MSATAQPPSFPFAGKWKLREVKSPREAHSLPLPEEGTVVFSQEPDGIHYLAETLFSDGQKRHADSTFRLDGTSYPVIGSVLGDTLNARQTDGQTMEVTITEAGRVAAKAVSVLSDRGNLMTTRWEVLPAGGEPFTFTTVSEREE